MAWDQRRTAPRYDTPADWSTRYRMVATPEVDWRPARLIDLSETGAAIEPFGLAAGEMLNGEVELAIVVPELSIETVSLRGEVRHVTRSSLGRVRAGISFAGASEETLSALLSHLVTQFRPVALGRAEREILLRGLFALSNEPAPEIADDDLDALVRKLGGDPELPTFGADDLDG